MPTRIGIDICDAVNMAERLRRRPGLREDIFSPDEIRYCESQAEPFQHYAARYAAKEALVKAAGIDLLTVELPQVELVHTDRGRPAIVIHCPSCLAKIREALGSEVFDIDVSVSHERRLAVASVIIEFPRPASPPA